MVPIDSGEILSLYTKIFKLNHPVWGRAWLNSTLELFFKHKNGSSVSFNLRKNHFHTKITVNYASVCDKFTNIVSVGDALTLKDPIIIDKIVKDTMMEIDDQIDRLDKKTSRAKKAKKQLQTLFGIYSEGEEK